VFPITSKMTLIGTRLPAVVLLLAAGAASAALVLHAMNTVNEELWPRPPVMDSVVPAEGRSGEKITIRGRGFRWDNDVGFSLPEDRGARAAYINQQGSLNGRTITVEIPHTLGACPITQVKAHEFCPLIGFFPPQGDTEMWVVNHNGESNRVAFRFTVAR